MVIISIIKNRKKIYRKEGNKVIEIAAMILGADMRNINETNQGTSFGFLTTFNVLS